MIPSSLTSLKANARLRATQGTCNIELAADFVGRDVRSSMETLRGVLSVPEEDSVAHSLLNEPGKGQPVDAPVQEGLCTLHHSSHCRAKDDACPTDADRSLPKAGVSNSVHTQERAISHFALCRFGALDQRT